MHSSNSSRLVQWIDRILRSTKSLPFGDLENQDQIIQKCNLKDQDRTHVCVLVRTCSVCTTANAHYFRQFRLNSVSEP